MPLFGQIGGSMEPMTWWHIVLQALGWWNWDRAQNRMRVMRRKKHQIQTVFHEAQSEVNSTPNLGPVVGDEL